MASLGTLGFVKGITGRGLENIDLRRKEEAEFRKAQMLAELQRDTAQANFLFEQDYKRKQPDKDMSDIDFEAGERIVRDADGNEIRRMALSASDMESYKRSRQKEDLSLEATRANIDQSKASAEASRASAARSRRLDSSDTNSGAEVSDFDRANELLYRYKKEVEEAAKSGNISESAIRSGAVALVENSRTGDEAQSKFLEFLNNYRTGRKFTDQRQRTLDDF